MNELFKANAAKILACYNNVEDIEKGGVGSGKYVHHKKDIQQRADAINECARTIKNKNTSVDDLTDMLYNIREYGDGDIEFSEAMNLIKKYRPEDVSSVEAALSEYDSDLDPAGGTGVESHKSQESELEKGGEGSRGGKVIGHTRSGKPVYASKHASHKSYSNFTKEDHEDAHEIHGLKGASHEDKMDAHEWKIDEYEQKDNYHKAAHHANQYEKHKIKRDHHYNTQKLHEEAMNAKMDKESSAGNESEEDAKKMMNATSKLSEEKGTQNQYRGRK